MIAKSFGEIPAAGPLTEADEELLGKVRAGFDSVGDLVGRHRLRQAIAEAMRVVGEVNKYVTDQAPFKLKGEDERERLGTILHVTAQAVVDLNTILSPFLPHSSNAVHATFGGEGEFMPMPRIEEVADLDDGQALPGDHGGVLHDASLGVPPGPRRRAREQAHTDLRKLDEAIIEQELDRLRGADEDTADGDA